jgi:hypothetical protein
MKQLVSYVFLSPPLLPREKALFVELVCTGSVYRGGNNTEPLDSLGRPGREREYPEERTLISRVHDAKEYEGNNTSYGRVFLLEAGEDSRENSDEVIHLAFVFISV